MELRHLRYFVAVADELNFTRAAARLHLAQPSLTRQIRDLEEEIAVPLFDRTKNRITLTDGGRTFLVDARRLLADCDQCVQALQSRERRDGRPLRIGYVASMFHRMLPLTLAAFHQASPETELQLFEMTPVEQRGALEERTIDLGFAGTRVWSDAMDLAFASVGCHEMLAALPLKCPQARETRVDLLELRSMLFIGLSEKTHPGARAWLVAACREAGFAPKIVHEAPCESAVIHLVASGLGVAVLPETSRMLAHEHMVFRGLRQRLTTGPCAVWRVDNDSAALRRYVEIVKEITSREPLEEVPAEKERAQVFTSPARPSPPERAREAVEQNSAEW